MPSSAALIVGYPALIVSLFVYNKNKSLNYLFWAVVLLSIISFGMLYIIQFIIFIHLFPTYIVVLITIIIIRLIPYNFNNLVAIFIFILLSSLIGLNTQIISFTSGIFNSKYVVTKQINDILHFNRKDVLKLTGKSSSFLDSYKSNDFISFGANEAVGGFWEYPKYNTTDIETLLENHEITYTKKNDSLNHLKFDYTKNSNSYKLKIEIIKNSKVISSLIIKDYLPNKWQGIDKNIESLESFDIRLEYLLRHNIWNYLIFVFDKKKNISTVISDFLSESIKFPIKNKNWSENIQTLKSVVIYESKIEKCSNLSSDKYKDYSFSKWKNINNYTKVVSKGNRYVIDVNGTFFTTKIYVSDLPKWSNHNFSFSAGPSIYAFKEFRTVREKKIRLFKFSKSGKMIRYIHIDLPKNIILGGRDWRPISHVSISDGKMLFRLNSIYQDKKKHECKYHQLEVNLPE